MTGPRLTLALEAGALGDELPARIAVFGPRAGHDLSALPMERLHLVQGFKPDHDAFAAAGYDVGLAPEGRYGAALVCLPRAKEAARVLIAEARDVTDGPVLVDGQKEDGIDSLLKTCRARGEIGGPVAKAHGKLFWITGGDFADWRASPPREIAGGFVTVPGVFSADGPDPGSAALAAALPEKLPHSVVDLGAGWGYLSRAILARRGVEELHLVEADAAALDCARTNVTDPRAVFHWADATRFGPENAFDGVVTNPPFHQGRAADPGLGRAFIEAAHRLLKPSGRLWLAANRHLPYERALRERFGELKEIGAAPGFKLYEAAKPRRGGR